MTLSPTLAAILITAATSQLSADELKAAPAQSDSLTPLDMITISTETEALIAHGEIVFRYEADSGTNIENFFPPHRDTIPNRGEIIFNFRNFEQFRIVVREEGRTIKTIVSDGEFIEIDDDLLWDYRFFESPATKWPSGVPPSVVLEYEDFRGRMWPYYLVIRPHLFPESTGLHTTHRSLYGRTLVHVSGSDERSDVAIVLQPDTNAIVTTPPTFTRFVMLPEFGYRLTERAFSYEGEVSRRFTWDDPRTLSDGRPVMGIYRMRIEGGNRNPAFTSTIEFSASDFTHLPHETEFVIDYDRGHRRLTWWPQNNVAQAADQWIQNRFGKNIRAHSMMVPTIAIALGMIAVVGMAILVLLVRRARKR